MSIPMRTILKDLARSVSILGQTKLRRMLNMRKVILYLIPVVALSFFALIMTGESYFKKPRGYWDNVPRYLSVVENDLTDSRWDDAKADMQNLEGAWNKVVPRIQFSVERDRINGLSKSIARINGAILAKDKSSALIELSEAKEHWNKLNK